MANISYLKAATSCLPFVGPFVNLYDQWEIKTEIDSLIESSSRLIRDATQFLERQVPLFNAEGGFDRLQNLAREGRAVQLQAAGLQNQSLVNAQKFRIYAISGMVGNVLSVAVLVGLTAFGILSSIYSMILGTCFTFRVIELTWNLHLYNQLTNITNQTNW